MFVQLRDRSQSGRKTLQSGAAASRKRCGREDVLELQIRHDRLFDGLL